MSEVKISVHTIRTLTLTQKRIYIPAEQRFLSLIIRSYIIAPECQFACMMYDDQEVINKHKGCRRTAKL